MESSDHAATEYTENSADLSGILMLHLRDPRVKSTPFLKHGQRTMINLGGAAIPSSCWIMRSQAV